MDLYARKIIAWTLVDTMEVSTVIETINKVKACRNTDLPLIIHSDRAASIFQMRGVKPLKRCSKAILIVVILTIMPASNLSIP